LPDAEPVAVTFQVMMEPTLAGDVDEVDMAAASLV
jgi:hypothetical protein